MIDYQLPELPLLKRHLWTTTTGDRECIVLSEDNAWFLQDRLLCRLLPLLDGNNSLDSILDQLANEIAAPEIFFRLYQLMKWEMLASDSNRHDQWAQAMDIHSSRSDEQSHRVRLVGIGPNCQVEWLRAHLQACGIDEDEPALPVVVTDHVFRPELASFNRMALSEGRPWMLCKLVGKTAWIGPAFHPGVSGCLTCLRERLQLNRQAENFVARKLDDLKCFETSIAAAPETLSVSAAWAAQEISFWLNGSERLVNCLLSIEQTPAGLQIENHHLIPNPRCPDCGAPRQAPRAAHSPVPPQEMRLTETGFRSEPPERTLERLQKFISPITGVVTWLHDFSQDSEGLFHSYGAGHNFAVGTDGIYSLQESLRSRTGGKGATSIQAKVSAVCEAIERYCGVYRGDQESISAEMRSMAPLAIHPHDCLLFSATQYANRDRLNADPEQGPFHRVPHPFAEDIAVEWSPVVSLSGGPTRYLPSAYCYFAHPDVKRWDFCSADGNGCAAGSCLEEAILQGLLELIERDSTAIWWYNRIGRPEVDWTSFQLPYVHRVAERYARERRDFWILDLTADLPVPVFAAVSRRVDSPAQDILFGLGAHIDPKLAMLRAVTELNQFLPAVNQVDARGSTQYRWPDDIAVRFWKRETLDTQPQLKPDRSQPPRALSDYAPFSGNSFQSAIEHCTRALAELGMDAYYLDQSQPELEMHVVRVIVPGLRHFWRRLGPGRLYDVPVRLGWLDQPTREPDLNPVSIFF